MTSNTSRTGMHFSMRKPSLVPVLLSVAIVATIAFIWWNALQDISNSMELSDSVGSVFGIVIGWVQSAAQVLLGWTGSGYLTDYSAFVRKLAHFLEYMLLGLETAALGSSLSRRAVSSLTWMSLFVPLLTAVIDEYLQSFLDRTSLVSDVLIDFSGATCGVVCVAVVFALVSLVRARCRG